jgi:ABC-type polysaccharide/polyol phosphate export permease
MDNQLITYFQDNVAPDKSEVRQTWGIFWGQLKIFMTYRTWVVTDTFNTIVSIAIYYFLSLQVQPSQIAASGYGTSYLAFSLIGIAFANYLWFCINRISHSMQSEIREGTFETIASSPIRMRSYLFGQAARGFLVGLYYMVGALAVGVFGFNAPLHFEPAAVLTSGLVLVFMILSHLGLGIFVAGIVLVYKQADPITFMVSLLMEFFAGALFPLQLLANYPPLAIASELMPYTYALDALRKSLIQGATLANQDILFDLAVLVVYAVILLPLGLWSFNVGYDKIRKEGTTSTY